MGLPVMDAYRANTGYDARRDVGGGGSNEFSADTSSVPPSTTSPSSPPSGIPSMVSPSTLALLARSLPPDRLRIFLVALFRYFGVTRVDNLMAISHILLSGIEQHERLSSSFFADAISSSNDDLHASRTMTDEQVEKALSDGTPFQLVPALTVPSSAGSGGAEAGRQPPIVRWVWRSMAESRLFTRTTPASATGFLRQGGMSPFGMMSANDPTSANPFANSLRNTSENVLSILARDIEDTIFQTLTSELARLATRRPPAGSE